MSDDDSIKVLLEKLCSLQEQTLAKLSEALDRSATARLEIEKLAQEGQRFFAKLEEAEKKARARAAGQMVGMWARTAIQAFMLALIVAAIIIVHYLK